MQTRLSYDLNEPLRKQSGRGPLFFWQVLWVVCFSYIVQLKESVLLPYIILRTLRTKYYPYLRTVHTHTICVAKSYVTIIIMTFALVRCIYAWDRQQHKNVQHSVEMLHFHDFTWNEQRIFECVVLFALFSCESD